MKGFWGGFASTKRGLFSGKGGSFWCEVQGLVIIVEGEGCVVVVRLAGLVKRSIKSGGLSRFAGCGGSG